MQNHKRVAQQKTHANMSTCFTVLQRVLHINTRNTAVVCCTSYPDVFFVTVPTFRIRPVVFFVVCDLSIGETHRLYRLLNAIGADTCGCTYLYIGAHYYTYLKLKNISKLLYNKIF